MEIIETISDLTELDGIEKGCILTIGNFDGVHIGHQKILKAAKQLATERKTQLVALTFEPHPVTILQPQKAHGVLTTLTLKEQLLDKFAVDYLLVLKSSPEFLHLSSEDFVDQFLIKNIQPSVIVEGEDFNFGFGRTGNVHTLQSLATKESFEVEIVEAEQVKLSIGQNVRASSTIIRNLLEDGKIADANTALGRPYRLVGRITPGKGKGIQLGFPTANITPVEQIVPAEGVYAGFAQTADTLEQICSAKATIPAALNIGHSKTYGDQNPLLTEAHLLTENIGDLKNKFLAIEFVKKIRNQIKFDSDENLAQQIAKDCNEIKNILNAIKKD